MSTDILSNKTLASFFGRGFSGSFWASLLALSTARMSLMLASILRSKSLRAPTRCSRAESRNLSGSSEEKRVVAFGSTSGEAERGAGSIHFLSERRVADALRASDSVLLVGELLQFTRLVLRLGGLLSLSPPGGPLRLSPPSHLPNLPNLPLLLHRPPTSALLGPPFRCLTSASACLSHRQRVSSTLSASSSTAS